ncbi:hypothetical protein [Rhodococcus sp. IEGM 1379]|uniref:hypothetical protein n=1 Tax=Rhodococcus sp. IEGM 1379 TaxID=3047086 RepID=UPI0024B7B99E|nr:hypothetical protein [Rhodococcus sp. IEGM 1379]MDI9915282.1 hypothetical protein [Rhodococcus sp. IEGM 1379]
MNYDFAIAGGTVIDGTGSPRRTADVAIVGDRIAEIGPWPFLDTETVDAALDVLAAHQGSVSIVNYALSEDG